MSGTFPLSIPKGEAAAALVQKARKEREERDARRQREKHATLASLASTTLARFFRFFRHRKFATDLLRKEWDSWVPHSPPHPSPTAAISPAFPSTPLRDAWVFLRFYEPVIDADRLA